MIPSKEKAPTLIQKTGKELRMSFRAMVYVDFTDLHATKYITYLSHCKPFFEKNEKNIIISLITTTQRISILHSTPLIRHYLPGS